MAARFLGISDLDGVKILLSDRLSSGCAQFGPHRKEIGQVRMHLGHRLVPVVYLRKSIRILNR